MLTKNTRRILDARDVIKPDDLGSDGLSNTVVRQDRMSLRKLGMWNRTALDDGLIVAEHDRNSDRNPHVSERSAWIHDLFHCNLGCNKLRAAHGALYRFLLA